MSSSPTRVPVVGSTRREALLGLLARVPDPRDPRGVRHPLARLLAVGIGTVLAGARSFVAIGEWASDAGIEALTLLGLTGRAPDEATFRRLFARLDADQLDRLLGAWLWTRTDVVQGRRRIAIDGKTVRGARRRSDGKGPHLVW